MLLWEIVTFGAPPLPGMPIQTIVDKAQAGELRHLMYGPVILFRGLTIFHGFPIYLFYFQFMCFISIYWSQNLLS